MSIAIPQILYWQSIKEIKTIMPYGDIYGIENNNKKQTIKYSSSLKIDHAIFICILQENFLHIWGKQGIDSCLLTKLIGAIMFVHTKAKKKINQYDIGEICIASNKIVHQILQQILSKNNNTIKGMASFQADPEQYFLESRTIEDIDF